MAIRNGGGLTFGGGWGRGGGGRRPDSEGPGGYTGLGGGRGTQGIDVGEMDPNQGSRGDPAEMEEIRRQIREGYMPEQTLPIRGPYGRPQGDPNIGQYLSPEQMAREGRERAIRAEARARGEGDPAFAYEAQAEAGMIPGSGPSPFEDVGDIRDIRDLPPLPPGDYEQYQSPPLIPYVGGGRRAGGSPPRNMEEEQTRGGRGGLGTRPPGRERAREETPEDVLSPIINKDARRREGRREADLANDQIATGEGADELARAAERRAYDEFVLQREKAAASTSDFPMGGTAAQSLPGTRPLEGARRFFGEDRDAGSPQDTQGTRRGNRRAEGGGRRGLRRGAERSAEQRNQLRGALLDREGGRPGAPTPRAGGRGRGRGRGGLLGGIVGGAMGGFLGGRGRGRR